MKITTFLLAFGIFICTFPSTALAGGGADTTGTAPVNTSQVQSGNGNVNNSPTVQTGNAGIGTNTTLVQSSNNSSGLTSVSSTAPLTQLQTGNYQYSSTSTQFSGNNIGGIQCGLSVGAGVNNANTSLVQTYTAEIRYSTAQCPDYKQISEQETKRVKLSVQGSAINTCIIARRDLVAQGKDPNGACPPIDKTQF